MLTFDGCGHDLLEGGLHAEQLELAHEVEELRAFQQMVLLRLAHFGNGRVARSGSAAQRLAASKERGEIVAGDAFPDLGFQIGLTLLPRNRSPGSLHEGLHLLQSEAAIFVGIHCLEDSFVSRLKFLQ
jgi:hypothetical protein